MVVAEAASGRFLPEDRAIAATGDACPVPAAPARGVAGLPTPTPGLRVSDEEGFLLVTSLCTSPPLSPPAAVLSPAFSPVSDAAEKEVTSPRSRLPLLGDANSAGLRDAVGGGGPVPTVSDIRLPVVRGEEPDEEEEDDDDDRSVLLPQLLLLPPPAFGVVEDSDEEGPCFLGPVGRFTLKWQSTLRFRHARQGDEPSHCCVWFGSDLRKVRLVAVLSFADKKTFWGNTRHKKERGVAGDGGSLAKLDQVEL